MAKKPNQNSVEETDINNDILMQMDSEDSDDFEDSLLIQQKQKIKDDLDLQAVDDIMKKYD